MRRAAGFQKGDEVEIHVDGKHIGDAVVEAIDRHTHPDGPEYTVLFKPGGSLEGRGVYMEPNMVLKKESSHMAHVSRELTAIASELERMAGPGGIPGVPDGTGPWSGTPGCPLNPGDGMEPTAAEGGDVEAVIRLSGGEGSWTAEIVELDGKPYSSYNYPVKPAASADSGHGALSALAAAFARAGFLE